jgi:hypothetical protein
MPRLIQFLLVSFADGAAMGLTFGELLLWTDTAGLASLMAASEAGAGVALLFLMQGALIFGTAGAAVSVMNLPSDEPEP